MILKMVMRMEQTTNEKSTLIDRVAQRQIIYHGTNLKREYLSYAWRKKRSGEVLDEPEDGNDHLMDALRYAVDDLSRKRFDF